MLDHDVCHRRALAGLGPPRLDHFSENLHAGVRKRILRHQDLVPIHRAVGCRIEGDAVGSLELVDERRRQDGVDGEISDLEVDADRGVGARVVDGRHLDLVQLADDVVLLVTCMVGPRTRRPPQDDVVGLQAAGVGHVDQEAGIIAFQVAQRHIPVRGQGCQVRDPGTKTEVVVHQATRDDCLPP